MVRKNARVESETAAVETSDTTAHPVEGSAKRKRVTRNFPAAPFEEPLGLASQIFEFGSGEPVRRLTLFNHLGRSPESGGSRQVLINANKYGLITGSSQSELIQLTADGARSVDPQIPPRDQARARIKLAIEDVDLFARLHAKFEGRTIPAKAALVDAATELGTEKEAAEEAIETFILNLRFVGLLVVLSGAERIVSKDHALDQLPASPEGRPQLPASQPTAVITSEHAHYERTCFYITPIGQPDSEQRQHSDLFLGQLVEPALQSFGLEVIRADGIDKPGIITRQIIEYIVKSRLVIVDLSFHNPNVFYELAIRHMMRLPIVQLIRKADAIPFDINQVRTIVVDTTSIYTLTPKVPLYQSEISAQVRRALDSPDITETPISTYFPGLKVSLN